MLFQQFYLKCLAHASYVIGDERSRTAAVVDPQRDVEQYLEYASAHGLEIKHVVLTHLHADFIAGHVELRNRAGAAIYLGHAAQAEYAFTPLQTGDVIRFGDVQLSALETPGHTPESVSLVVYDLAVSDSTPYAVLTGDTLFIGDVGRPDLMAAPGWAAADLAGLLFDSLRMELLSLPDSTLVYPAHGAGSLCGKALSQETVSTIGEQRRSNYALQPMDKTKFIELVTADQPDAPPYFGYDAVMNTKERPTLEETLARELTPLTLDEVLAAQAAGAQVLDTRDPAEFAAAHLAGSINVGLGGQYATWAGTVLNRETPIIIVAEPGAETESAMRLGRIGFDQVHGFLDGGLRSAESRPDLIATTERLGPERSSERLASASPPIVLDVRTPTERAQKHIAGSLHVPLNHLVERLQEVPADRPVLVHCAGGYRSSIAASLMARHGRQQVSEIAGGLSAWETAGLPVQHTN
jgi:glyoxylase-like metal-dependent hydrolase (beta-lactamase superfamily II)